MLKKIAILLILISLFSCSDSTNEKTQTPFEQAQNHLRKFETDAADSIFKQLADSDLSDPSGYFGLGLKFEREFRFLDALHVYMSIIDSRPSFAPALKRSYEIFKMYELESEMIRSAVSLYELDPNNSDNQLLFAEALIIHNDSRRARKILSDSNLEAERPGEYYALIALSLLKNDQIDSAETEYNKALASKSNSTLFYIRAADYIQELGMYDSAIALSNISLKDSDYDFDYLTRHFFRTLQVLNIDEARNVKDKVVSMGGGEKLRSAMDIFIYHRLKEHPPAIKASVTYRKYVPKGMSSSFYELSARGPLFDGLEIMQEMMYMRNIMEREKYNFNFQLLLRYLIAIEYAKFDSPVQALNGLEDLPGISATRKQARLMKIRSQFNCGLTEDAINSINSLEKSHRNQPDWLTGLGRVLWRIRNGQDYQRSEELLDKALSVDKWYLPAFENLLVLLPLHPKTPIASLNPSFQIRYNRLLGRQIRHHKRQLVRVRYTP